MGTEVEPELSVEPKGSYYIPLPIDREQHEPYLLSELETLGMHCKILQEQLRKVYNSANSVGLDGKWGNHLSLIIGHLQDDLRHLEYEIKRLRDNSS